MRSWSTAGSAADPETSRRARPSASASAAFCSASATSRWYIVGTPKTIVAPCASAAATPSEEKRPR